MTSSPRPSTGVGADDVTQSVDDVEVVASADDEAPDEAADEAPDDVTQAVEAVSDSETSVDDEDHDDLVQSVDGARVWDTPDGEGPQTDPHGMDAIDEPAAAVVAGGAHAREPEEPATSRPITSAARRTGKVRKARLRLLRVEPWSVMKSAFVLSIAIGITFVVATATLWSVIDAAGVFQVVGDLVIDLTESDSAAGVDVTDYVGFSRVVGLATVIAVIDVVLLTALATLFAFLYNLSAALLGGFEITLAEDD